jgi:type I restriction enzyme, S subunit
VSDIAALVAHNLDIWTGAIERKSGAGRGGGKRINLYGIDRLRALILELAVRGKLVPQDSAEESAEELLRKIRKERAASKPVGKSLKAGEGEDRLLCSRAETPQGWATVRLSDVILGNVGGGTPSKAEPSYWGGDIPWASVKDVGKNKFVSDTQDRITELGLAKSSANLVPAGNIILVTRMGLGQLSINTIDLAINQDLRAIFLSKHVDIDYCYNYFLTCEIEGAGMTVKGIKLDDLLGLPFPLPPLAEQRRIVAKVDELMALCDALERQSADALTAHQTLVEALLTTLVNSDNAADLAANWARLESHFDTLFTTDMSIEALKQTILDLAMRGKLVEQDAVHEAAIKGREPTRTFCPDLMPHSVPDSWRWCAVKSLGKSRLGKMLDRAKNKGQMRRYLRNANVRWFDFDLNDVLEMPFEDSELSEFQLDVGDILICEGGEPGRTAVWDGRESGRLFQKAIHRLRFSGGVNPYFFAYFMKASALSGTLAAYFTGSGIQHFTGKSLDRMLSPLPPLVEQERIVAKVDGLMALCDALKARLAGAAETRRHLADAIVERVAA